MRYSKQHRRNRYRKTSPALRCERAAASNSSQDRHHRIYDFGRRHFFHATKIDWAFAQETGPAFDVMPDDNLARAKRTGQLRLRRSENSDDGKAEKGSEMHGAGIVR